MNYTENTCLYAYIFPHNENRFYKKKLTLGLDNVVFVGAIIDSKSLIDSHWKIETIKVKRLLRFGKMYYQYQQGEKIDYAHTIAEVRANVGNATIKFIDEPKPKIKIVGYSSDDEDRFKRDEPKIKNPKSLKHTPEPGAAIGRKKTSYYELLRQQFDKLPASHKFCCYCEIELDRNTVTRDHLLPVSKGGQGKDYGHENIRPCCSKCNSEKSNLLLREYIGKLNHKFAKMSVTHISYDELQRKIINANKIAKEINSVN